MSVVGVSSVALGLLLPQEAISPNLSTILKTKKRFLNIKHWFLGGKSIQKSQKSRNNAALLLIQMRQQSFAAFQNICPSGLKVARIPRVGDIARAVGVVH